MPEPGPEEFSWALFKVADLLESLGAPYLIFGAVAVGIWGRVRATLDVDFMIQTDDAGFSRIEALAESAGLAVDRQWLDDQDLIDAAGIAEEQRGKLDEAYLDLWARRLGIEQELAYVLRGGTFDFG